MNVRHGHALPMLAAAVTILFWSSAFPAISYGLEVFTPPQLALLRFAIASLLLAVPVAAGAIKLPPRRDWPAVAALGVLGITVYQLSLGYAMTRIPAGAAAVIIALTPGVTSALAAWCLREKIGARAIAGLVIAFAGVVLVTLGSGRDVRFEPLALLVLVSVLATSAYFIWQKPLLARSTPIGFSVASIFAGTLGLLPFGLDLPATMMKVPAAQLGSVLYLALAPTILGYLAWNWALSRAPASQVSSLLYVQPLLAGVIAWLWLGQTLTGLTIAGGALALGGVILTLRGTRAATSPTMARTSTAPTPAAGRLEPCTSACS